MCREEVEKPNEPKTYIYSVKKQFYHHRRLDFHGGVKIETGTGIYSRKDIRTAAQLYTSQLLLVLLASLNLLSSLSFPLSFVQRDCT